MASNFGSIGSASVEVKADLKNLTKELRLARVEVVKASSRIETAFRKVEIQGNRLNKSFAGIGRAASIARNSFIGLAAVASSRKIIEAADTWAQMTRQLKLVTTSSEQLASVQDRLFEIAQNTRQPLQDVTRLFSRFALVTKNSGLEQNELLNAVESVSAAVVQTGVTTREAAAGLQQLSQGFGKARLDGDELKSVLENIPILGEAIAQEMNTTVEALRDIGAEGSITRGVQLRSFRRLKAELGDLDQVQATVGESATRVRNSFLRAVGVADQATESTAALSDALTDLADKIDDPAFTGFVTTFLTGVTKLATGAVSLIGGISSEFDRLREEGLKRSQEEFEKTGEVVDSVGDKISNAFVGTINKLVRKVEDFPRVFKKSFGFEVDPIDLNGSDERLIHMRRNLDFLTESARKFADQSQGISQAVEAATSGSAQGLDIDEVEAAENLKKTTAAITKFIEEVQAKNEIMSLSEGVERDFGKALAELGLEFDAVAGKVKNVEGSFEGLGRLRAILEQGASDKITDDVNEYVDALDSQGKIADASAGSQRRLAEALDALGISFEVVDGKVRSAAISQERLIDLQSRLDGGAYDDLNTAISDYVAEIERSSRAAGLESDAQRELAGILDEQGVAWEAVAGKVRIVAEELQNIDLSGVADAAGAEKTREAQKALDDYLQTARENADIAAISDANQRQLAEALRGLGIEFEVVAGNVRVLNQDLKGVDESLEQIEADRVAAKFDALRDAGRSFGNSVTSALGDAIIEGKKLDDVLQDLIKQFARIALQQVVGNAVSNAFAGAFGGTVTSTQTGSTVSSGPAGGGGGAPIAFARGGIVNGAVSIAGGKGVMGEAGPEGIVPLTRTSSGNLGIEASGISGGNTMLNIIDQRSNGADIEVQETQQDGQKIVEAIIRDKVGGMFRTGAMDPALANYGAKRQGVQR